MSLCLLKLPGKFATSDIIKYLMLKRKLYFKKTLLELKIQVSSCSGEKPDAMSEAVYAML